MTRDVGRIENIILHMRTSLFTPSKMATPLTTLSSADSDSEPELFHFDLGFNMEDVDTNQRFASTTNEKMQEMQDDIHSRRTKNATTGAMKVLRVVSTAVKSE